MKKAIEMNKMISLSAAILAIVSSVATAAPDEEVLGKSDNYPIFHSSRAFHNKNDKYLVGTLSNMSKTYKVSKVKADPSTTLKLQLGAAPEIKYNYQGSKTLQDYLDRNRVTGLMIIKDDKVLIEKYQYDRTSDMRFVSMSVAKSVTSILVGIALQEGKIKSLDDTVDMYVKELSNHVYAKITIRNLLRMSSGVKFDRAADGSTLNHKTWFQNGRGGAKDLDFIESVSAKQGEVFNYASGDAHVLGLVIRGATKTSLSDYMSEKLWIPMGAESDGEWLIDTEKTELTALGFNAVLRDYARLGMLMANDGVLNGKQIVSKEYLIEATSIEKQPELIQPNRRDGLITTRTGYGYMFWTHPFETRTFAMYGHYGQAVFVQPDSKIVIVVTSAWQENDEYINKAFNERFSFFIGVLRSLGGAAKLK